MLRLMFKRYIFFSALFLFSFSTMAQKVIQMEKEGGVYKIACKVNGAKMKMIFDTGASSVSISMAMANYLYENDYLTDNDVIGSGKSHTANGAIVDNIIVNLRDIDIDGIHLRDVSATVLAGQNVPLLFGQSAIKQLGSYTINGSTLILNSHSGQPLTDEEIDVLSESIISLLNSDKYYSAIDNLKKIESAVGLGAYGYSLLARCYVNTKQYQAAIDAAETGLNDVDAKKEDKLSLYNWLAMAYVGIKDFQNSIKYSELSLQYETDKMGLYYAYCQIGYAYEQLNNKTQAENNYKHAIKSIMDLRNISTDDLFSGHVSDKDIGFCLYSLASLRMDEYDNSYMHVYAVLGALCNDRDCISLCNRFYIDYHNDAKKMYNHLKKIGNISLFD